MDTISALMSYNLAASQPANYIQNWNTEVMIAWKKEDGFQRYLGVRVSLESDWMCEERDVFLATGTEIGDSGRGTDPLGTGPEDGTGPQQQHILVFK